MTQLAPANALHLLQAASEFKARLSGEFASVHGLSVNDFWLLLHLESAAGQRLSRVELAKYLHVSASTVTRMARPLEKVGLLGRESHPRDARLAFVVLTEAGRTKLDEAKATFVKRSEALFADRWDSTELEQLSALLKRLVVGSPAQLEPTWPPSSPIVRSTAASRTGRQVTP
jgi:DNA-binding MarR family transcriptional regulator